MAEIVSRRDFSPAGFRWLGLKQILWRDPKGKLRKWESAERSTRAACGVDGVAIVAHVTGGDGPPCIVLEAQFRPPQGNVCIELPAGLIDEGETAAEAAVRELREETGYGGTVGRTSTVCYSDPGLTNANMQFVDVHVDADAPANQDVHPELEEGEFIEVWLEPEAGLYNRLLALQRDKGWDVDARLLMYAAGLEDGRAAPQQRHGQTAVAEGATTAGNGESRQSAGSTIAPAEDAATSSAATHDANGSSTAAAGGASSPQRGNGQLPPAAAGMHEGSAASTPQRQQAGADGSTNRVCSHCGHDSTGEGLVMSAVRGISRVGSQALLKPRGQRARPPPAAEVAMAHPGSFASLRFMEPPPDGNGTADAADIGQPDALHPRDMAKGPTPLRMSLADLEKAGIESVRIVPRGTLRWRRVDRLLLVVGGVGLVVGAICSQVAAGMALAIGLRYHPNHRLNWSHQ